MASACNILCIFHQCCPLRTQHFAPMRNPVVYLSW